MSINITVEGGSSKRLLTAGKYCSEEIVITATGGAEDLSSELAEQEQLITTLQATLRGKAAGDGGGDNGVLPVGYTPVPSIKFTGAQAINTGVICTQDTEIVAAFTADGDGTYYFFGVTNDAQTAYITAYRSAAGGYWRFGNQRISLTTPVDEEIVWGIRVNKKQILRGNIASTYTNVNDFVADKPLLIGGRLLNDGSVEDDTMMIGKVSAFRIYDGGDLIRHFVPCKNADGVCGLWDLVTESFFASMTDTPLEWSFS